MPEHTHTHEVKGRNLFITIILNLVITASQIVGGLLSGSLALLSDAVHNFSDVLSLVIAWWANKLSMRDNSTDKTFGYRRAEILATFVNASVLAGIGIYLLFESVDRFLNPEAISSQIVIYLALLSIVLNTASVLLVKNDSKENMNIKAAYLHLLTDVMTSVAVLVGGVAMLLYNIFWIDSVVTVLIAIYLLKSSWNLIKESASILMQFSPKETDLHEIRELIEQHPEVGGVHHAHFWRLDDKKSMFEAHIDLQTDMAISEATSVLSQIELQLRQKLGITHSTLQIEYAKDDNKNLVQKECCH